MMKKLELLDVIVRVIAIVVFLGNLQESLAQTPLPNDVSLASPSFAIKNDIAVFAGAWHGAWNGSLPTVLIVEHINKDGTATLLYSWGVEPESKMKSGWIRLTGKILAGKLHLLLSSDANIDFRLEKNGDLLGVYTFRTFPPSYVELTRINSTDPSVIKRIADRPVVSWEEIRIPEQSEVGPTAGKTLMLQTTVYKQSSPGRHPVIILNHGSTGPGIVPVTQVYRDGAQAVLLHSLGYIIVVPMRKGRGMSDGPFFEESVDQNVALDSAIEDLNAVVEYIRKQNDVDPSRIMVAGVSRGGLLAVAYAGRYPTNVLKIVMQGSSRRSKRK